CRRVGPISDGRLDSRQTVERTAGMSLRHSPALLPQKPAIATGVMRPAGRKLGLLGAAISPPQREPVSSKRYATRHGKGILRPETGGRYRRQRPNISVSVGLLVHSRGACLGYVGDIRRDCKSCNIN